MKIGTTWGANGGQKLRFGIELYVKLYTDERQKNCLGKLSQHEGQNFMSRRYVPRFANVVWERNQARERDVDAKKGIQYTLMKNEVNWVWSEHYVDLASISDCARFITSTKKRWMWKKGERQTLKYSIIMNAFLPHADPMTKDNLSWVTLPLAEKHKGCVGA